MIYCSTGSLERLFFHPNNNLKERHWVDLEMSTCDSTFMVTICCDEEWVWEFYYDKTNYDLVKHVITDCIFEAESVGELIEMMDEAFEEFFYEITVDEAELQEDEIEFEFDTEAEVEIECDGDCDHCVCSIVNGCNTEDADKDEKADSDLNELILAELKKISNKLDKGV